MTPTWYSIRNHLEQQLVTNNLKHLQFLASIVTAYPCLDIWFRSVSVDEVAVRIQYMQCNKDFVADTSWERDGEEPRVYQQITGSWKEIRSNIITQLPRLSRLSDEKRHGLSNKGSKEPYTGGGLIFDINNDGDLVIQGRYGAIRIEVSGVDLPFEALRYEFNCCKPVVTVDESYLSGGGGGGGIVIVDRPPGTARDNRYDLTTPTAEITLLGVEGVVAMTAPATIGPDFLLAIAHEWVEGLQFGLPQGGPTSLPEPTQMPGNTSTIQNWSSFYGQGFCSISATVSLPQISKANGIRVYETEGVFPFPRFTTTDATTGVVSTFGTQNTTYYQSFGAGNNLQSGTWRVVATENGSGTDFDVTFNANNGFTASITSGVMSSPTDSLVAWSSNNVDLGTRQVYRPYDDLGLPTLGNEDISSVNLGIDTVGLNEVPQGDYPFATQDNITEEIRGRVWRGYLGVTL